MRQEIGMVADHPGAGVCAKMPAVFGGLPGVFRNGRVESCGVVVGLYTLGLVLVTLLPTSGSQCRITMECRAPAGAADSYRAENLSFFGNSHCPGGSDPSGCFRVRL